MSLSNRRVLIAALDLLLVVGARRYATTSRRSYWLTWHQPQPVALGSELFVVVERCPSA